MLDRASHMALLRQKRLRCAGIFMPRTKGEVDDTGNLYNNLYHSQTFLMLYSYIKPALIFSAQSIKLSPWRPDDTCIYHSFSS